ncbi:MAG: DUF4105 domain-containing protein [Spirochaetaceae bacterium]|nr:DUF4105 domain-containing protein [Spirochaetaceae bacterium]
MRIKLLKIAHGAIFYLAKSIGPKIRRSPLIVVLMAFSTKRTIKTHKCNRLLGTVRGLLFFFLLGISFFPPALFAGDRPVLQSPQGRSRGDYLTVKVAVIGPGDELYFWWGHIGLVIEDSLFGREDFYDWGVFSFQNENFFLNFALGRLLYSCTISSPGRTFRAYASTNRDITVYTLDLPADVKENILRFAENNVRRENRDYLYHHFRDNCATRVRDIIDMAVSGAFKLRYEDAPGRFTLRGHVRRHTWFSPFWDWILNFWMGRGIDRPISVWDEMFLPSEIGNRIADFTYTGSDGIERPLVSSVKVLRVSRGRPMVLAEPEPSWPQGLALGLTLAFAAALLQFLGTKKSPFTRVLGIYQTLLGLFFGAAGLILFFMTFFTNHDYTYHNNNILFVNPLILAAIPLGIIYGNTKDKDKQLRAKKFLHILWACIFLGGLAGMFMGFLPGLYQQNQTTMALILPLAFVLSGLPRRIGTIRYRWKKSGPAEPGKA